MTKIKLNAVLAVCVLLSEVLIVACSKYKNSPVCPQGQTNLLM